MRVFDSCFFNIIEKVSFGKTLPYLEKMLSETGFSYKNTAFMLYSLNEEPQKKALAKFPALEKYLFFINESGSKSWGLWSYSNDRRGGEIYVDKADEGDVYALFSKIPHTINFSFGELILGGVNWFSDSVDTLDWDHFIYSSTATEPPFRSNRIIQYRSYDDGRKVNRISVCIEVTDKDCLRNSHAVIERLIPYLGEPEDFSRKCTFSAEETKRFKALETEEWELLTQLAKDFLPIPKQHKPWPDPHIAPPPDPKLSHVADKFTLEKAFNDTGFERQKGQPNWLSLYSCTDGHGFLYEAYIQRLTYCMTNDFRVWVNISGYNFNVGANIKDYYVTEDGESLEILKEFARFCVWLREEYGAQLAEKFGDTPAWYNAGSVDGE